MSRRRRHTRQQAVRSRIARAKVLRRRARWVPRTRAAATAVAVTLAGAGVGLTGAAPAASTLTAGPSAAGVSALRANCSDPHTPSSEPYNSAAIGGTLFFSADDGIHGRALWKSDGTAAGTVLVKDISPRGGYSGPESLTAVDGTLFFTVDDGVHGRELWKSDGTRAGTVLVKDINPGDGYEYYSEGAPASLTDVGGKLFFTVDDGVHGRELWKSDGTRAGTVLVKDINPGDAYEYYSEGAPESLTGVGGELFFTVDDGVHGRELWKSDGTGAGTALVKDIRPDTYGSEPGSLVDVGGKLFLSARDGVHGAELWASDGTATGTVLVKDIRLGARHAEPRSLTAVAGNLFFTTSGSAEGRELWTSDGTEAGTVLVKAINTDDGYYDGYGAVVGAGGRLFFTAIDEAHGRELWTSDGTEAGTVLVKDIRPDAYDGEPDNLTAVGGAVFFSARDGVHGPELWTSDGTEAGTVLVKDIWAGARSGQPRPLSEVGGELFFRAVDEAHGSELWTSDGTEAGTVLVKDINAGGQFSVATSGTRNTTTGTLKVKVRVAGAGRLVLRPVGSSKLKTVGQDLASAGSSKITLTPTKAGLKVLRREGKLRVSARFTFTPCGGTGSSVVRKYTLILK